MTAAKGASVIMVPGLWPLLLTGAGVIVVGALRVKLVLSLALLDLGYVHIVVAFVRVSCFVCNINQNNPSHQNLYLSMSP